MFYIKTDVHKKMCCKKMSNMKEYGDGGKDIEGGIFRGYP